MLNSSALSRGEIILKIVNGVTVAAEARGSCELRLSTGHFLRLNDVLYFPNATRNIISVSILCKYGYNVQFNGNECLIHLRSVLVGRAENTNGLYVL